MARSTAVSTRQGAGVPRNRNRPVACWGAVSCGLRAWLRAQTHPGSMRSGSACPCARGPAYPNYDRVRRVNKERKRQDRYRILIPV